MKHPGYVLPSEFNRCLRQESPPPFEQVCFFFMEDGGYVPPGKSDPCCDACLGWSYLREAYADAKANHQRFAGGGIVNFYRTQVAGNRFTDRRSR
jgi:hypothetical protein